MNDNVPQMEKQESLYEKHTKILDKSLTELDSAIIMLSKRLEPILSLPPIATPTNEACEKDQKDSKVVEDLKNINKAVVFAAYRLKVLHDRTEV